MDSHEKLHVAVAVLIFIGLFSFLMLPPPLTQIADIFHGFGTVSYKIARAAGMASDVKMCSLADVWNMQGINMEVLEVSGGVNNYSCALMDELNVSVTTPEKEKYGEHLFGEVQNVYIVNNLTLNKLFFVSYILLGLVAASLFGDFFLFLWPKKPNNAAIMGILVTMTISSQILLLRIAPMWKLVLAGVKALPGNNMLATVIFLILSTGAFWFIYAEIFTGYNQAKKSKALFSGLKTSAKIERNKALQLNDAVADRLREK